MNATEITALLAVCSSADNRKPNAEMVQFWLAALGDLTFVPCRDAVVAHYQESTDWIMPAHIRKRVRRERVDRIEDDVIPMPPGLDPDDTAAYIRVLRAGRQALAEGRALAEPEGLTRRSLRELGGPVRRVNELPDEQVAPRLSLARQAAEAARIEAQSAIKPEPEPLLQPHEYGREPTTHREPATTPTPPTTEGAGA